MKKITMAAVVVASVLLMPSCVAIQGTVSVRYPDMSTGPQIPGVEITFTTEDGSENVYAVTGSDGSYSVWLREGRYVVTASHPDYETYSSSPGFVVVTDSGPQYVNLFLRKHPDVLLVSGTALEKTTDFDAAVSDYLSSLYLSEDLVGRYVEIDSPDCLNTYGIQVDDMSDWEEIRSVLQTIIEQTGSRYILLLGGWSVIPRPLTDACCNDAGDPVAVLSDAWYIDFDLDQIVDHPLSISRLPDLGLNSSAVVSALRTAQSLHDAGGYTLDNPVRFAMDDYTTPPYGVCDTCTEQAAFFDLMSNSDYITFTGHGSPTALYSNDLQLIFSVDYIDDIDLQENHPVIVAYTPCSAGGIFRNDTSLAYEFMRTGAAAYTGRTTTLGTPAYVVNNFPPEINEGTRIGDALFPLMRETVVIFGDTFKANAGQICLYGDPTLKRQSD